METLNTVSSLKVTGTFKDAQGNPGTYSIRLSDESRNGVETFAITGTVYLKGRAKIDRNMVHAGAIGDEIATQLPELSIFNDLHLCDYTGAPMHAAANMFYHIRQDKMKPAEFMKYYKVTEAQYNTLELAKDVLHFTYLLIKMSIPEQWKEEADRAIKILENKTGKKFESKATRRHLEQLSAETIEKMDTLTAQGHYNPAKVQEREEAAAAKKVQEKIEKLKEQAKKDRLKIKRNLYFKTLMVKLFGTHDNSIFYDHSNKIELNYTPRQYATYSRKYNKTDLKKLLDAIDRTQFAEDLTIDIKSY